MPANHNVPHTPEARAKIAAARALQGGTFTGKRHSAATRAKISASRRGQLRGSANHQWGGGTSTESRKERIRFRRFIGKRIFARDNFTCAFCGERGGTLHVDHVARWADHPEARFDPENLRTLCHSCHFTHTFHKPYVASSGWGLLAHVR